jgi:hypothetical protein
VSSPVSENLHRPVAAPSLAERIERALERRVVGARGCDHRRLRLDEALERAGRPGHSGAQAASSQAATAGSTSGAISAATRAW